MVENESTLINNIKAKKITQMPTLDHDDIENLWLVLGYKNENENKAENYKVNIIEFAQLLIDSGILSGSGNSHHITYSLTNITTVTPSTFNGSQVTIVLSPVKGYLLPDDITVEGANVITYNKTTGVLKLIVSISEPEIIIEATGIAKEYPLNLYLTNITSNELNEVYHVDDIVTIELNTTDPFHYDLPQIEDIAYTNVNIVNYINNGSSGILTVRITGTGTPGIRLTGVFVYVYYFGHSIPGDNVLSYNANDIPVGAGTRFNTLISGRNECPIDWDSNYLWPDNINNGDVFVIVPKKYFIPELNIYRDDNFVGYKRKASTLGLDRLIQQSYEDNSLIYYSITYEGSDYWVYCISHEGISEFDSFENIGDISGRVVNLTWTTTLPTLRANQNILINPGVCNVVYANDQEGTIEWPNFDIGVSVGTFNSATKLYNSGEISENTPVTFTALYRGVHAEKNAIIPAPGPDDNLLSISYVLPVNIIESGKSFILDKRNVIGHYRDGSSHAFDNVEDIIWGKIHGTITKVNDNTSTYTAPANLSDETTDTISVSYKGSWSTQCQLTITPVDCIDIYWPTVLPTSMYDNETLHPVDIVSFKKKPDNTLVRLDSTDVILTSSLGTITQTAAGLVFTPPSVEVDTPVSLTLTYGDFTSSKTIIIKKAVAFETEGLYYYIGQYLPTPRTNPNNNIKQPGSSIPGWRLIPDTISNYRSPISILNDTINIYENVSDVTTYYVVLPENVEIYTDNIHPLEINPYGDPIDINGVFYIAYQFVDNSFSKTNRKLFYTKPQQFYWYVGTAEPVSPEINPAGITPLVNPEKPEEGLQGWHIIPNHPSTYTDPSNNPIYNGNPSIPIAEGLDDVDFYLVLPIHSKIKDAFGDQPLGNPIDTMIIDEYQYNVYQRHGLEFAYTIYYSTT